ncbi:MAG: Gfo/Idh/MocA family protein, partial [Nostoc sp.]
MYNPEAALEKARVRVGLVGSGYAAKFRAEAFLHEQRMRSHLVAVVGHTAEKTETFAKEYEIEALSSWQELVEREDIDLVVICTINRDHGAIARAALT